MRGADARGSSAIWFYVPAAAVLALDQLTKALVRGLLHSPVTLIPGFLHLRLNFNTGGAFGVLPNWAPLFIIVALAVLYAVVKISRTEAAGRPTVTGLGLLAGGAAGNLLDRILSSQRGVTDFIDMRLGAYTWPTYNVADIGIVAGAVLLIASVYILEKRGQSTA